jgi:hypothetical protein
LDGPNTVDLAFQRSADSFVEPLHIEINRRFSRPAHMELFEYRRAVEPMSCVR